MSNAAKSVPTWVRIVTAIIALLNVVFGIAGYASTSVLFPDLTQAPGLTASSPILVHATREFSARNLSIGLALLIVSRVGVPESIAIVTIIRALTELQTIALTLVGGVSAANAGPGLGLPLVFLVAEVLVIRKMFALVAARERAA